MSEHKFIICWPTLVIPIGTNPVPPLEVPPQACTFDQAINNKLHHLVTKLILPRQDQFMPTLSAATLLSLCTTFKLTDKELRTAPTKRIPPLGDEGIIFIGPRHKKHILQEYEQGFGNGKDAIVTKNKGKSHASHCAASPLPHMKQSIRKYYRVQELMFYNVITTVLKEHQEDFTSTELAHLCLVNKDFLRMIPYSKLTSPPSVSKDLITSS